MSLSRHLQTPELLRQLPSLTPRRLKPLVMEQGLSYVAAHPEESAIVANNLRALGLPFGADTVSEIQRHVVLHYFEKFVPLCGTPAALHDFLASSVDAGDAITAVRRALDEKRGVLVATSHFGAVELLAPTFLMHRLPVTGVLRFATPELSASVSARAAELAGSGRFGQARFVEIGRPGTIAAVEMAAVLRRAEVLMAVFDEATDYSVPVQLLGATVRGGAGLQRILRFVNAPVDAFCAFMVRTGDDRYRLEMRELAAGADPVAAMYRHLESVLTEHLEQWYFLHEEIPFVR